MTTVPIPQSATEVPGPVPGNTMINAYVQLVGRMAYFWGYPMVNAKAGTRSFASTARWSHSSTRVGVLARSSWCTERQDTLMSVQDPVLEENELNSQSSARGDIAAVPPLDNSAG